MSFEKFGDLCLSRMLYCSRLDKLPDALEGLFSAGNWRGMTPVTEALHRGYNIVGNRDQEVLQSALMRRLYFVNCWHINDSESRAMWRLYAPHPESVVVVSRVVKLCAYARICTRKRLGHTIVSKVRYAGFDTQRPDWVSWGPALFKDVAYRMEQELRIVATPNCPMERAANMDFFKIPLDPRPLIEAVVVHPHAYSGFRQTVNDFARRHLPRARVSPSNIANRLW
jgi:hypothetical protein